MRHCSKNMGMIKTSVRTKNQNNQTTISADSKLTDPDSYGRFRAVYKFENNELNYKFQFLFSEKDCKLMKEELRKLQDEKV